MAKFETALEVLEYLPIEEGTGSTDDILTAIRARIAPESVARRPCAHIDPRQGQTMPQDSQITIATDAGFGPPKNNGIKARYNPAEALHETQKQRPRAKQRKCYIYFFQCSEPHDHYPTLCKPCGDFDNAESNLSLLGSLNPSGKTAVVTGGRVNLGFTTALRLHRCGVRVIVSSRYPQDAEARLGAQSDSYVWERKLTIVGGDFRSARDAFRLVALVKNGCELGL